MKLKELVAFLLTFVFIASLSAAPALACEESFSDVSSSHWAYREIHDLAERGVISGYPDSTFKPDKILSRAEFAKMMVLALKLPVKKPDSPTFNDVPRDNWAFPFTETAKFCLTGYRATAGDYFKPEGPAVREDMAVALVKALGYGEEAVDESSLDFADEGSISPNLRKYVAIAVSRNLMQGDCPENCSARFFRPQDPLKRSEAAVLLSKLTAGPKNEVKVTYGSGSAPAQAKQAAPRGYEAPVVSGEVRDGKVVLNWQPIADKRLNGYKVVVSKQNPNPKYPENGYLYWITDRNRTYAVVDNHDPYKNGDFGTYLTPGEKYYFSITAVYGDRKVPGNTVALGFPGD